MTATPNKNTHDSRMFGNRVIYVPRRQTYCEHCKSNFLAGHCGPIKRHCPDCDELYIAEKRRAGNAVTRAIRNGKLKPASEYQCVDCDRQAMIWDHRDYRQKLDVVPTCKRCNAFRRGALWSGSREVVPPHIEAPDCAAFTLVVAA